MGNDIRSIQSDTTQKANVLSEKRVMRNQSDSSGTAITDTTYFSKPQTSRISKAFKGFLGIKEPLDYINKNEFYETPFKLKALVPPLDSVRMVMTPTTRENSNSITYGLRAKQPLYLRGTTGMGKTNLVLYAMSKMGVPLYEISGEDTMDESNIIGRILPRQGGGFEWQDGKAVKAIKPVVQVPLPLLEKPAKAELMPQGTIVNPLEAQEVGEHAWIKVQDLKGKTGWVLAQGLSTYKTPQFEGALQDSPDSGKETFAIKPGDLLGVMQEKKINGEKWVQVKTPVQDTEDPLKINWKEGWIKSEGLADVAASKYATQVFDEPQAVKQMLEPGLSLYWQERMPDKMGGNVTWSRVQIPDQYNSPGEEGYLPDCAPRPKYPVLEHNFIRASGLLLDESNLILPGVKKRLNSLLDHRRMLWLDENRNERVKMHPTTMIFLTGNPLSYSGREQESADFLRRCHVITFKEYNANDYMMILENMSNLDTFTKLRIIGFHMEMADNANRGIIGKRTGPYAYGTRDLMKLASHMNTLMPEISKKLDQDSPIYEADINPEKNGMVPVTSKEPAVTLKQGESVQIVSHEEHDGDPWTRVRYGDGKVGYIKGKLDGESLYQLIWKEARKIYERRIVDDAEKEAVEAKLSLYLQKDNKPEKEGTPVIKKLDNGTYQFGDLILPVNPPGGRDVPDKDSANLIVNENTPEAARRVQMIAEQIFHGDDTMLVGPTASGKTSYPSYVALLLNRNMSYFNASDQTDKTRFIGKLLQKRGGGQFDFEWQNGLFTEAVIPKAIRATELYTEPGGTAVEKVAQNTPLYYLKQQKVVDGEKYSLVQRHEDWMTDREQTGKNALWVKDKDIQSDIIIIDEGNAARSGALEGANSLFDKNRRFLILEDFDGRKVYAHPSCVIFFTANPPEYGGLRYTGVNQISPAARNRFTEVWFPEISQMPTAGDVDDQSLEARRKEEDGEMKTYVETWLKNLPNKKELAEWAVQFYREVRNMAARHDIGARRPSGEPLVYTIGSLKNLASKISILAPDEIELTKYVWQNVLSSKPEELKQLIEGAEQKGTPDSEIKKMQSQWLEKKTEETIGSMSKDERLVQGSKFAFMTQALHEFTDDFEDDADKEAVLSLISRIVSGNSNAQQTQEQQAEDGAAA